MTFFQAIILSIVEGITEFLPISSTGHMTLVANFLHIQNTDFTKSFEIIIQLGAIFAVVVLYAKRFLIDKKLWVQLGVACLPTFTIGFVLYSFIKHILLGNPFVVLWALFLGGIAIICVEKLLPSQEKTLQKLTWKQAFSIGVFQILSLVPGVSRSAATIIGGRIMGLTRKDAVEFSFLLAVPTMIVASGYDMMKSSMNFTTNEYQLLGIGLIGAFITALIAIRSFVSFVQTKTLIPFGIYRILLSACYFFFLLKP
jgi:undecaprenyl-diphosphatase